ncbi:MAG: sulfotransferase family 2 domain-containing protein [Caulobacteraceae bacterium]|nr:sulfotransferase family 2 domain-containing protein [Caulobacteraceae bacterium]
MAIVFDKDAVAASRARPFIRTRPYSPHAVDWRFLPEDALVAKDRLRGRLARLSNLAAHNEFLGPLWTRSLGRQVISATERAGVIFVHIPKTGGTSVSRVLYGRNLPHYSARFYGEVFPDLVRSHASFSIIRHPVARLISGYKFMLDGGSEVIAADRCERSTLRGLDDLGAFVDFLDERAALGALPPTFRAQSWYIEDDQGDVAVDRLFTFTSSRGPSPELIRWMGLRTGLPHLNATGSDSITASPRVRDKIERIYARDLALFRKVMDAGGAAGRAKLKPR